MISLVTIYLVVGDAELFQLIAIADLIGNRPYQEEKNSYHKEKIHFLVHCPYYGISTAANEWPGTCQEIAAEIQSTQIAQVPQRWGNGS